MTCHGWLMGWGYGKKKQKCITEGWCDDVVRGTASVLVTASTAHFL